MRDRSVDGEPKEGQDLQGEGGADSATAPSGENTEGAAQHSQDVVEAAFDVLSKADSGRKRMELITALAQRLGVDVSGGMMCSDL
jgi:hypothetical protein